MMARLRQNGIEMMRADRTGTTNLARLIPILAVCTLLVSGCATTPNSSAIPEAPKSTSRLEVLDEVGFTIVEEDPISDDVRFAYDEALRLIETGAVEQGAARLQIVAESAPALAAPLIDLGVAHHVSGDLEEAERYLLMARDLNPNYPMLHNELGVIYRKTGRFAEARRSYEAALDIFPGYHFARRNLAVLCDLYLADLECALDNYEAYMTTVPSDDEAEIWIADLRLRMEQ